MPPCSAPRTLHITATLLLLLTPACENVLDRSLPSAPVFSDPSDGDALPMLYRPAALARLDNTLYITEQASLRVRALSPDNTLTPLFDAHDHPHLPIHTSEDWGLALLPLNDQQLLLLSLDQPALLLDMEGRATVFGASPSSSTLPADGVRLADLDWTRVHGATLVPSRSELLLAIDTQIFRAPLDSAIEDATLELVAGNGDRGMPPAGVHPATSIPLELQAWVGLAGDPEGGVYFVDGFQRIRYVAPDGRSMRITGEGSQRGFLPIPALQFASRFPARTWLAWHDFTLYFPEGGVFRTLDTRAIDLDAGTVDTDIELTADRNFLEPRDFLFTPEGALVLAEGLLGSILVAEPGGGFSPRLGPPTPGARYNILPELTEHDPYRLRTLVLPQAISPLAAGESLLVSMPLNRVTSWFSRDPFNTFEFLSLPKADQLGHVALASDNDAQMVLATRLEILQQRFTLDDAGEAIGIEQRQLKGLRNLLILGIPGPGTDAQLPQPLTLATAQNELFTLFTDLGMAVTEIDANHTRWTLGGPLGRSPLRDDTTRIASLDIQGASTFDVHDDGRRLFAIPSSNTEGTTVVAGQDGDGVVFGGISTPAFQFQRVIGGGDSPLAPDLDARDLRIDEVFALDYLAAAGNRGFDTALLAFRAQPEDPIRLAVLNGSHQLQFLDGCDTLPEPPSRLYTFTPEAFPPTHVAAWFPGSQTFQVCRAQGASVAYLGETELPLDTWTPALGGALMPAPAFARDTGTVTVSARIRGLERVNRYTFAEAPTAPVARDVMLDTRPTHLTVSPDGELVYFELVSEGESIVWAGAFDTPVARSAGEIPRLPRVEHLVGGGEALADGSTLRDIALGFDIQSMVLAPDGTLYIAVADTQAIWELSTGGDGVVDPLDTVHLLWRGAPLFAPSRSNVPMALGPEGALYIGSGSEVYRMVPGEAPLRHVGGGALPLQSGMLGPDAQIDEVVGLYVTDAGALVVLSRGALFEVDRAGRVWMRSEGEQLVLDDGSAWDLRFNSLAQPVLAPGRPGEMLMLHPPSNGILSLPE